MLLTCRPLASTPVTVKVNVFPSKDNTRILPPASPELNPTENVWQYLRQTYLSNRVFRDYDDVVEASSSAWNKLTAEPGRIYQSAREAGQPSVKVREDWYKIGTSPAHDTILD